jgi:hypothetical protein
MKHIKKYTESKEQDGGPILTWRMILDNLDKIKLVNLTKSDVEEFIKDLQKNDRNVWGRKIDLDSEVDPYFKKSHLTNIAVFEDFAILVDENDTPTTLIYEYELSNPFEFGDIIICPGHDSITCYNKVTGESISEGIR